jgi:hypothetical protein
VFVIFLDKDLKVYNELVTEYFPIPEGEAADAEAKDAGKVEAKEAGQAKGEQGAEKKEKTEVS